MSLAKNRYKKLNKRGFLYIQGTQNIETHIEHVQIHVYHRRCVKEAESHCISHSQLNPF